MLCINCPQRELETVIEKELGVCENCYNMAEKKTSEELYSEKIFKDCEELEDEAACFKMAIRLGWRWNWRIGEWFRLKE